MVRIAVVVARSLQGSGFATRVTSMLESYTSFGHEVDVFHYRFPHERGLPHPIAASLRRYVTIPMERDSRFLQHASRLPPLVWNCTRAHSKRTEEEGRYDVVQAETSNTWGIVRTYSAGKRLAVFHDDDEVRLRSLAKIAPKGARRVATGLSAQKYARWQRVVMREADRVWFASAIERDRLATTLPVARTKVTERRG